MRLVYGLPFGTILVLFAILLIAALEVGLRLGRGRHHVGLKANETASSDVTLGSTLALLGLMLAFTYSFSMGRTDLRKQATVEEANAIGTDA